MILSLIYIINPIFNYQVELEFKFELKYKKLVHEFNCAWTWAQIVRLYLEPNLNLKINVRSNLN